MASKTSSWELKGRSVFIKIKHTIKHTSHFAQQYQNILWLLYFIFHRTYLHADARSMLPLTEGESFLSLTVRGRKAIQIKTFFDFGRGHIP